MRTAYLLPALALAAMTLAPRPSAAQIADAKELAQKVLDQGAATFSTKNAKAVAANYTEDGILFFVGKDNSTGQYTNTEEHRGKNAVEEAYRRLFEKVEGDIVAKNTVDSATLLAPDLMVIQGRFQPNVNAGQSFPFVQIRVKQGDAWLLKTLHFFTIAL